jgi:cysteinyl-tRNA synthetase
MVSPLQRLTNRFIDAMHADSDELGLMHPDREPRATDDIKQMQGMIGKLIENELAYQAEDGDVNFAVVCSLGMGIYQAKH